jgi:hypothetical protein
MAGAEEVKNYILDGIVGRKTNYIKEWNLNINEHTKIYFSQFAQKGGDLKFLAE